MAYVETPGGTRIWFTDHGGDGPPVLLAHGFSASGEMWWPQLEALTRRCRLIVWDARGHGRSTAPAAATGAATTPPTAPPTMETLAGDLRALTEHLGLTAEAGTLPIIAGMSFGGQIALQYACDAPHDVRALVLSDTTTRGEAPVPTPVPVPDVFATEPGLAETYVAMMTRPDLTPDLGRLTMPALVIYGANDSMIAPGIGRLTDGLPQCRVVVLSGAGHGSSGQRPQAWSDAVTEFLDDLDRGGPIAGESER